MLPECKRSVVGCVIGLCETGVEHQTTAGGQDDDLRRDNQLILLSEVVSDFRTASHRLIEEVVAPSTPKVGQPPRPCTDIAKRRAIASKSTSSDDASE
jgi:hypothetical protein